MTTEIALARMGDLLAIPKDKLDNCEYILINLNSVFSVVYYQEVMDALTGDADALDIFITEISSRLKTALMAYSDKKVLLYYASEPAKIHTKMYPKWRQMKYRDYASNHVASEIWKHFHGVFDTLKDQAFMIDLKDMRDMEPAFLPKAIFDLNKFPKRSSIVVSRDKMDFVNLEIPGIRLWDGVTMFEGGYGFEKHTSKKLPKMPSYMLKYYFVIRGEDKHCYPGARGYGEKKALKFSVDNFNQMNKALETILGSNWRDLAVLYCLDAAIIRFKISEAEIIKDLKF